MLVNFAKKTLIKKEALTSTVHAFYFEKDSAFSFLPGQYIEITFPDVSPFPTREFTICSSPLEKNLLRIVTKQGESVFKKRLFSLKEGETVLIKKPTGGFILNSDDTRERIFLSGGLGITPFYSMILFSHQQNLLIPMTLFASFKKRSEMLFYDELQSITKENSAIRSIYTLTGSRKNLNNLEKGRFSQEMLGKYVANTSGKLFFIAGPNDMVDDMQELLLQSNVDLDQIRIEYFNGY